MALLGRDDPRQAQRVERRRPRGRGRRGRRGRRRGGCGRGLLGGGGRRQAGQCRRRGDRRRCHEARHAGDPSSGSASGLCRRFPAAAGRGGVECRPTMAAPLAPVEVIERSRRGEPVDPESVDSFVRSWLDGTADDAQMAAWCMVACLRGMAPEHVEALTRALLASGDRLELGALGPTGDLASTGGVGDTTTLVAAPLAAALGVRVAKMTGRGLAPHGRHARQARGDPGLPRRPAARGASCARSARWGSRRRADLPAHARRPPPRRPARRHGHGPRRGAHRGLGHEQEDRGRSRRDRARREGGRGGVLPRPRTRRAPPPS